MTMEGQLGDRLRHRQYPQRRLHQIVLDTALPAIAVDCGRRSSAVLVQPLRIDRQYIIEVIYHYVVLH